MSENRYQSSDMYTITITDGIPQNSSEERYLQLMEKFQQLYGQHASYICRAPGRVNLIGEHIDYCGYSVFPMAIDQDIVALFSINHKDHEINLQNSDKSYSESKFNTEQFDIRKQFPLWDDYFKCGVQGIRDKYPNTKLKGMNILIDGTIPRSAGLSSSSALVVCASLTTAIANNITIEKNDLAELCAECEKYIGTQGGGMDQASSCLARTGSAMMISFNPLKVVHVLLPVGCAFVVTHSLTEINKAATDHFNTRVVECRIGTQILAQSKGLDWRKIRKPFELQEALKLSLSDMEKFAVQTFHLEPYTVDEICALLGVTVHDLIETSLGPNTKHVQQFELHKRLRHVFSEANRVLLFKQVCDSTVHDEQSLHTLGELMNQSHYSCSKLYECSSSELDELTAICRESGALGSRLTGAGWGGCAVSLVRQDKLDIFIKTVKEKFYDSNTQRANKGQQSIFATLPGCGVYVVKL
ncbi:unnamed protein product [Didymodactylos carnosus]|uniref:Galactokinase n=1 Tax=Didymodactylos carnosus TaxID=1234261 RepID=A0A813R0P4_9BILA|nr:unnamed protein product [Didymodactylos carnosus]CAF0796725.1 unnamed protein product [Didymodactylos carnosus]CAF3557262.1 unnamed protein product [Didymodactylos carnosus]CAF3579748.1 unnamed protein product [Didymodactylos carnosus]